MPNSLVLDRLELANTTVSDAIGAELLSANAIKRSNARIISFLQSRGAIISIPAFFSAAEVFPAGSAKAKMGRSARK